MGPHFPILVSTFPRFHTASATELMENIHRLPAGNYPSCLSLSKVGFKIVTVWEQWACDRAGTLRGRYEVGITYFGEPSLRTRQGEGSIFLGSKCLSFVNILIGSWDEFDTSANCDEYNKFRLYLEILE